MVSFASADALVLAPVEARQGHDRTEGLGVRDRMVLAHAGEDRRGVEPAGPVVGAPPDSNRAPGLHGRIDLRPRLRALSSDTSGPIFVPSSKRITMGPAVRQLSDPRLELVGDRLRHVDALDGAADLTGVPQRVPRRTAPKLSMSASPKTTIGSLPPSSRTRRFSPRLPRS